MIYRNHAGDKPIVHATATIHPSAVVIGNVQIGEKVFVGPNAVIRADEPCPEGKVEAIIIESEVNIQDGVIIHALGGSPVHIGKGVSLAHGAVIHGPCHVGENCFVGFKSVVFKAGVLTEADVHALKPVTPELSEFAEKVRKTNIFLAEVA